MSNLSAAFRGRDEDMLTHGAASSAEEVATVSVTDGLATVTAVLIGESAVTLTATDAAGSNRTAEPSALRGIVSVTPTPSALPN